MLSHNRSLWPIPGFRHVHESLQILVLFSGKTDILWEGSSGSESWQTDQIALIPPNLIHQVETVGSDEFVEFLDMRINLAHRGELARAWRKHAAKPQILQGKAILNTQLRDMLAHAATMPLAARQHAFIALGWQLLAMVNHTSLSRQQTHVNHRLQRAERFMADHLHNPIDTSTLAQACDLSVSQINRLYQQHLHTTPAKRLMKLRLERAKELLPASLLTLKQIAHECGFACVNHFSRVFRQHAGMTPGAYRQSPLAAANSQHVVRPHPRHI